ncbi:MFS transporter [candidate division KSB1 bacterium]|nr:MFS transporter [candidate division KSB1 bacterium]
MKKGEFNAYRPWQVKIFAATWLSYAGYYFCRKAFYVVKSPMAFDLGLTAIDLAHLGTAYLVFYMVGQFSSAFFGRKLGPKLLLLVGMAISLVCNLVFGIANSYATFLLFLSLNGLAQGTGWPGCIGSLAFWYRRKQRGTVLGVWATCYQLGSVAATSFAAFLLGLAGWRWSFFGASLVLLVVWAVVLVIHPNRPEDVGLAPLDDEESELNDTPPKESDGKERWSLDVILTVVLMGLVYFCIKFLRYALWSWAPYFLNKNFALQSDYAGYLSTIFDITGFLGVIFAGAVSDKLFKGKRSMIALLMLSLMTLSFLLMYTLGSTSLVFFAVSMGLAGFMLYGPDSLLSGVGAIDVTSRKGALAAAGIINGIGSIGPIFQEEIIGWLYETRAQALAPIFSLLLAVAGLGTILTFFLWLRSKRGVSKL